MLLNNELENMYLLNNEEMKYILTKKIKRCRFKEI